MKKLIEYLTLSCLSAAMCLLMAVPAMAQRGGGGGGHSGGGGGGGHVSGGGGFSGGGGHVSSGFSGGRPASVSTGAARPGGAYRPGAASGQRSVGYRGSVNGYRGSATGYRGGAVRAAGATGARPYVKGDHGAGIYGHGGAYGHYGWGRHYGYFYNHGYYGSLYWPWLGFGFGYLPYGCYPFYWGDAEYYYGDGFYYQYNNDEYTVVEPPVGAEIKSLPKDAQAIMINGQQYYEYKGVYYLPVKKDDGTIVYQVSGKDGELNTGNTGAASVTPKVGDIVPKLPADCRKVNLNGGVFYVSEDGIYYQQTTDNAGNTVYKIVALEAEGQGN
jgi:hypothetical protein